MGLQLEFTSWEVIMIVKIALFCLLASSAQAAPKPEADPKFLLPHPYLAPPTCKTELKDVTLKSCVPKPEKKCDEITLKQCPHGVFLKKREAEADPQFLLAHPYLAPKLECKDVKQQRCAVVIEQACEEIVRQVPQVVCDPPAALPKVDLGAGHPFVPNFFNSPGAPAEEAPAEEAAEAAVEV